MYDDDIITASDRIRLSERVKEELDSSVKGLEIRPLALLLGLAKDEGGGLVPRTLDELEKIRSSKKYKGATPDERMKMIAPRRIGGGSTENQLVRRLFSTAKGAEKRYLLPESVVGQSRLDLSDVFADPFLYYRVVLAQCVVGGMDYIHSKRGELKEDETSFSNLAGAVEFAGERDGEIAEGGNTVNIMDIRIDGVYQDWKVKIRRYIESPDTPKQHEKQMKDIERQLAERRG